MQTLVKFGLAIMLAATCSAGVNAEPEYFKAPSRMALLGTSKSPPQYSPIIKTQNAQCINTCFSMQIDCNNSCGRTAACLTSCGQQAEQCKARC
jgi:hypothetical protein